MWLPILLASCRSPDEGEVADPPVPAGLGVGQQGARRLSHDELNNTLRDLLGDETRPAERFLPPDVIDPFDNELSTQVPSAVLVAGLEALAGDVAVRLLEDPTLRDAIIGCSAEDDGCLSSFVSRMGRLLLRRPLQPEEQSRYEELGLLFETDGGLYDGVDVVLRAMLQAPSFVYRVELGTPTEEDGVFVLDEHELASRMSFLLWGSAPDEELLDAAAAGELSDPASREGHARRLLEDERARDRMDRFHAMWLGYWTLPHPPELTSALRLESRLLLEQIVFEDRAEWTDLFLATGTWADDLLAAHYGLPLPGSSEPVWVPYGDSGRQGLLSHGSFLSVNAKFGDTSPTLRGKLVRERLLCQTIPPPPPSVNVDEPPAGEAGDCKIDRYAEHRDSGSCKSCHDLIDPIGFGLENFDQQGRYREHDVGAPDCRIEGEGDLDGVPFQGPAGLARELIASGALTDCAVQQVYRLAHGHPVSDEDEPYVQRMAEAFSESGRMDDLFLALVTDEAFGYRREESSP
jgi:hypothetical protein